MVVEAIIEIPQGSINKYEVVKQSNRIKLDRVLPTRLSYPAEYGYIDNTLADDNDPLDILIFASEKTFPGCVVDARVIGYLDMIDSDSKDEKVIAVIDKDPRFDQFKSITEVPLHVQKELKHFFQNYKTIERSKDVVVLDFHDKDEAIKLINKCTLNHKYK